MTMADNDSTLTEPDLAEMDKFTPAAAQIFARKFPGVTLTKFRRTAHGAGWWHILDFLGTERDLLRFGLIDADDVPKKPKRLAFTRDEDCGRDVTARRVKGGLLEVRRWFTERQPRLDGEHPLSEFDVHSWPIAGAEAREPLTPETYVQAAVVPLTSLAQIAVHFSGHFGVTMRLHLEVIWDLLGEERKRVAKRQASAWRPVIVVDNTRAQS
jgi:hypothetical protein